MLKTKTVGDFFDLLGELRTMGADIFGLSSIESVQWSVCPGYSGECSGSECSGSECSGSVCSCSVYSGSGESCSGGSGSDVLSGE